MAAIRSSFAWSAQDAPDRGKDRVHLAESVVPARHNDPPVGPTPADPGLLHRRLVMTVPAVGFRHLPVRPDLGQLRRQAKDLLRAIRRREPDALAEVARITRTRLIPRK